MNNSSISRLGLLAALATVSVLPARRVSAALFEHQEVAQEQFIAVAVPRQNGHYNLLLLEQKTNEKQCWQESGSAPTQVDPLLLQFDFTGICGRSTDSNGYSIRQAGEDRGISHRLSIQKRGEELVLVGMPNGRQGQVLEIGRTKGLGEGLLKIHLDPDWRLTKRQYQGKTLGHIYLTTERTTFPEVAPVLTARAFQDSVTDTARTAPVAEPVTSAPQTPTAIEIPVPPPLSQTTAQPRAIEIPVPPPLSQSAPVAQRTSTRIPFPPPKPQIPPPSSRPRTFSGTVYRVMAQPRNSREQSVVQSLAPDSFRSSYKGRRVMQVGLFRDRNTAVNLKNALEDRGIKVLFVQEENPRTQLQAPEPAQRSSARAYTSNRPVAAAPTPRIAFAKGTLPVPRQAPLGNVGGSSSVFGTLPPPPPVSQVVALGPRYRVVVKPESASERQQVRDLVPDAFRSSYRGRTMLQVGSFTTLGEAQDRIRLLERYGFQPIMEKTQ